MNLRMLCRSKGLLKNQHQHKNTQRRCKQLSFRRKPSEIEENKLCAMNDQRMFKREGFSENNRNGHISSEEFLGTCSFDWRPGDVITGSFQSDKGFACLILNRAIRIPTDVVRDLWQKAFIRCTVDGGTNRWRHFLEHNDNAENLKVPDLVVGDFDSITSETRQYFTNGKTKFLHTPDQNATDFTKAVDVVHDILATKEFEDIIVFHETSGRLDHIMANLNTLHKQSNISLNIYLLSSNSLTWLLKPGRHLIHVPTDLLCIENPWCSLVPVGKAVDNVTTTGLKWNLNNSRLHFGGLVSTSNTYVSSLIEIETTGEVIWSMGLFSFTDD